MQEHFRTVLTKHDTDKSQAHSYHLVYGSLFDNLSTVTDVAEIGIYRGASLRAWRELFPKAQVLGLDFNPDFLITEERINTLLLDQRSLDSLRNVKRSLKSRRFDLIVDDASHGFVESLRTFTELKSLLKPDGWFVIEDVKSEDAESWNILARLLPGLQVQDLSLSRPQLTDNRLVIFHAS